MDICASDERKDMEKDIEAILAKAIKLTESGDLKELLYLQLSLGQISGAVERMVTRVVIED